MVRCNTDLSVLWDTQAGYGGHARATGRVGDSPRDRAERAWTASGAHPKCQQGGFSGDGRDTDGDVHPDTASTGQRQGADLDVTDGDRVVGLTGSTLHTQTIREPSAAQISRVDGSIPVDLPTGGLGRRLVLRPDAWSPPASTLG